MRVIIRVDASLSIGTGHVMRCLTLADALMDTGNDVQFICRRHEGNLINLIESKNYRVYTLDLSYQFNSLCEPEEQLMHGHWLGATQQEDIEQCQPIIEALKPDWIIVDHYALDYRWQEALNEHAKKLMVIDDLADRKHSCQLLLDQTVGRQAKDYKPLVSRKCTLLLGSQYALLRPEFAYWRDYSLRRRRNPEFKKLLISMGGVDVDNVTSKILETLTKCEMYREIDITVVMGATSPHLALVQEQAMKIPLRVEVVVDVSDMAKLMANSDLAIGAAGATTWERCCLGLPSIMIVIAENQRLIAEMVHRKEAALFLDKSLLSNITSYVSIALEHMSRLTIRSSKLIDGQGVNSVMRYLS